jgi:prophage antirepressor-like protein
MNNIVSFDFEGVAVRVANRKGKPWFVDADVCRALDIGNNRQAVARLDDNEKDTLMLATHGGPQNLGVISENGLYRLMMTSRKPSAERFKKWVATDVLPTIRKEAK